jgi:uncharacterized RDD family membrane protein YckC
MIRKYLLKSPIKTAQLTRFIAKSIDLFIAILMSLLFYPLGVIPAVAYLCIADSLQGGQSVGKKLMGLSVLSLEDGTPCSMKQSCIRNLPLSIPLAFLIIPFWGWAFSAITLLVLAVLEAYLLFKLDSGHRLGDVMADTTVVSNTPDAVSTKKAKKGWFDENTVAM